jgi:hypothetical protein
MAKQSRVKEILQVRKNVPFYLSGKKKRTILRRSNPDKTEFL